MPSPLRVHGARRWARAFTALLLGFPTGAVLADTGAPAPPAAADLTSIPPAEIEEVIVTGTRLDRDADERLGLSTTLGAETLGLSGASSISEVLRELPSVGLLGTGPASVNGGRGRETLSLRDLGESRTLILINGRRMVQSSNGVSEAVDLGNIPPALLQRVDVLRDGVSTIYGADAVAGVINFILKRDFDGLELNAQGGITQRGDDDTGSVNLLWGKNFGDRGNLSLAGSFVNRRPMRITDRDFSERPIFGLAPLALDRFSRRDGLVSFSDNPALEGVFFRDPGDGSGYSEGFDLERDATVINDQFFLRDESQRRSFMGLFHYEIADAVEAFSEFSFTRRSSVSGYSELAPGPTTLYPGGLTFDVYPDAMNNNPYLPPAFVDAAFTDAEGAPIDAEFIQIGLDRGFGELGPREFQSDSDTLRFVGGLRGELATPLALMDFEVYANYGRNRNEERLKNGLDLTRTLRSLRCSQAAQDAGECIAGDFFGAGDLSPEVLRFIRLNEKDRLEFEHREVGAYVSGSILELPAGPLKAAFGAEYREESGQIDPDPRVVSGDTAGLSRSGTRGEQVTRELYFETLIPLLQGRIGAEQLDLEISGRYAHYSSFGGRFLSRYGFAWTPVPALTLRGNYATAFRAPGISDLFLSSADSFAEVRDLCAGYPNLEGPLNDACEQELPPGLYDSDPETGEGTAFEPGIADVRVDYGGNPDLDEETARSLTLSAFYTPEWLEGLELSLDYYRLRINDPVVGLLGEDRLQRCLGQGSEADCDAIERDPVTGIIDAIDLPPVNFGSIETSGIEFGASYDFSLPILGDAVLSFQGNYVFDYEYRFGGIVESVKGQLGSPRFRGLLMVGFLPTDRLTLRATTSYIGSTEDRILKQLGLPVNEYEEAMYLDLSAEYTLGAEDQYAIRFGIENLMDRKPPLVLDGLTNTQPFIYDVLGRRFFLGFRAKFY